MIMPSTNECQDPFTIPEIIPANETRTYSYYLNPMENPINIVVTADKPIKGFRKTKSFIIHFVETN